MKRVIIFGIGKTAEKCFRDGSFTNFDIVALSDNDSTKWGMEYCGKVVIPPDKICKLEYDEIIIASEKYEKEIKEQLTNFMNIPEEIIRGGIKYNKYESELDFWREQYVKEKSFGNSHYRRLMLGMAQEESDAFLQDKIVADFGCGPRGSLQWMTSPKIKIGIDVMADKYLQEFAECLLQHNMVYVTCNEHNIPIGENIVDCLYTMNSLDHVFNLEEMCQEILRILKPGGCLIGSFNLNEPYCSTEPQTLTEKRLWEVLLKYFEIESYRLAEKGQVSTYENFENNNLLDSVNEETEAILWIKGILVK